MAPRLRSNDAVRRAAKECERLGRQQFLDAHGFGEATRYMVRIDDRLYDSKAIVGVAYGYEHPSEGTLDAHSFSGGVSTGAAAWQLQKLGFEIVELPTA